MCRVAHGMKFLSSLSILASLPPLTWFMITQFPPPAKKIWDHLWHSGGASGLERLSD